MVYRSERLAREARPRAKEREVPPLSHALRVGPLAAALALTVSTVALWLGTSTSTATATSTATSTSTAASTSTSTSPWLGAVASLAPIPSMRDTLRGAGQGGFIPPEVRDSTQRARVVSGSLFDLAAGTECTVRFASDPDACSAELRCDGRTLYRSGFHGLACVRTFGSEIAAWDAEHSFSFEPTRVRVLRRDERGATTAELELALVTPRA